MGPFDMLKLVRSALVLNLVLAGLLVGSDVIGENQQPKNKPAFSQLGFDGAPRKIVKEPKVKPPELSPSDAQKPSEKGGNTPHTEPSKPVALSLQFFKESSEDVSAYSTIAPKLHDGPKTDPSDPDKITSLVKWQRAGSDTCRTPGDERNYCLKAAGLREVIYRFSGNNDFYDSHCHRTCDKPGYKAVINTIKLDSQRGEEFRVLDPLKDCAFMFSKVAGRRWMFLTVAEIECVCLPANCELL